METNYLLFEVCVILTIQTGLVSSQNTTCFGADSTIRLNLSEPVKCAIPSNATNINVITDNIPVSTAFVTFQMHTHNRLLTGSLTSIPSLDTTMTNSSVGLDWSPVLSDSTMKIYVSSKLDEDVTALFMAIPYNIDKNIYNLAPVPGACNQEFTLEDDPTLHVTYDPKYQVTTVDFAAANVGYLRGAEEPICDTGTSLRFRLEYDFYVRYLEVTDPSRSELFEEIEKMMTVEGVEKYGKKMKNFKHKDKPVISFMTYEGHGAIYNIIVRDPDNLNRKAAYIPVVSYACNMTASTRNGKDTACQLSITVNKGSILSYSFLALAGLVLCYFGHRVFYLELFFFGALPFGFGFHMVFLANTQVSNVGIAGLTALFGALGGCSFVASWWRFGKELPTILLIALDLGILFSASLFFSPFGTLSVWQSTAAYGLTVTCGILIVPVFLIMFPKWLCILSSALWGSYMIVAAFSYFLGGILQYIIGNIVRRASVPGYAEAYQVTPFRVIDYTLIAIWPLLVLTGVLLQKKLVEGRPAFPPCPYKVQKNRRTEMAEEHSTSPKPIEHMPNSPEADENSPLLIN